MKTKSLLLNVLLIVGLLANSSSTAFAKSKRLTKNEYFAFELESGLVPELDLYIREKDIFIDFEKRKNSEVKLRIDASGLIDERHYPTSIKLEVYEYDASGNKILITTVRPTVYNKKYARNLNIEADLGYFVTDFKTVYVDLFNSNDELVNTYNYQVEALNVNLQSRTQGLVEAEAAECDENKFDDCYLKYILDKISFEAVPKEVIGTEIKALEGGRHLVSIPIAKRRTKVKRGTNVKDRQTDLAETSENGDGIRSRVDIGISETQKATFTYNPLDSDLGLSFSPEDIELFTFTNNGRLGIGVEDPRALLEIANGTAERPSMIINPGTLTDAPLDGAVEFDGDDFYFTMSGERRRVITTDEAYGRITPDLATEDFVLTEKAQIVSNKELYNTTITNNLKILFPTKRGYYLTSDANGLATWQKNNVLGDLEFSRANGTSAYAVGDYLTANGEQTIVIGFGNANGDRLINNIPNSIMLGVNSNQATMFIESANGGNTAGSVGIGTTSPDFLLDVNGNARIETELTVDTVHANVVNANTLILGFNTGSVVFSNSNGELTEDDVNFVWDDINNRLGLGTNTPTATLDINGDFRVRGGSPQQHYVLSAVDSTGLTEWKDISFILTNGGAFLNALNDSVSDEHSNLFLGNGAGLNHTGEFNTGVGIRALSSLTAGNGNTAYGYQAGDNLTAGNGNIAIGNDVDLPTANGSNQLNIGNTLYGDLANGELAIGFSTNDPDARLEVGNATRNSVDGVDDLLVADDAEIDGDIYTTKLLASANVNGTIANFNTGNFTTVVASTFNGGTIDGDFTNGSIIFSNLAGELTQNNDNFFWNNNLTRLGIGNNSPNAALDVNGQIMMRGGAPSNGYLMITDANGLASWIDPNLISVGNANLLDGLDSTQFLRSDTSDNFTSGTLTLDAGTTFDINSTAVSIADDNISFDAASTTFTQSSGAFTVVPAAGSNLNVSLSGTGDFVVNTDDLVVDTSSSYVGIGVTNPNAQLEVGNGTADFVDGADDLLVADDAEIDGDIYTTKLLASANVNGVTANFTTVNSTAFNGNTFNGVTFDGDFTNGSVIFSNLAGELTQNNDNFFWNNNLTRLGLGNNTPNATLDVNGQIMMRSGASNGYFMTSDGNGLAIWKDPNGLSIDNANLLDGLDSSQFLRSDTSDNYTSGTLTLDAGTTFDINSTAVSIADDNITFDAANTTFTQSSGAFTVAPAAGSNLNINLSGAGDLVVNTNDLYVDSSTSFTGIGTTTPATNLDINGSIRIQGGTPQEHYVLSALDNNGLATWSDISFILTNGGAFLNALNDAISDLQSNLFLGNGAGLNHTGEYNTGVGIRSLNGLTAGNGNTAYGYQAGDNLNAGNGNIAIGNDIDFPLVNGSNQLNIGNTIYGDLANGELTVGFSTSDPDARLEVGNATRNFVDGTDDLLVADDAEIDGDIYTTKLLASANINGTTANLTKVLASANVNGTVANFNKVLATGSVNGATANFTTGNITTINSTTVNATAFNGTTFNGGTIDGDFTNGSIIFSNLAGELTQNNDNFFWNNNLTRLGLGNNTPNATLDVNGQIMMRGGANNGYFLTSDANGLASWTDPTGLSVDNANLLDGLDSTQFLRSDTSDNYTSGTLTLDAGTTFDINSTAVSIADDNITFDAANTTFTQSSGAFTLVPAAGSNLNINLSGAGDLVVNTNDLYVDSSTSFTGIGTNTPATNLDINGNIRIQGGTPQEYYVLSALDDNGLATWSDISFILTNGGAFLNALNDAISDLQSNLFLGNGAGLNHTGEYNTGVGIRSLTGLTAGNGNTAYGYQAGDNLTAGNGNIAIGNNVDLSAAVGSNQLNIGNTIYGNLANGELVVGFSTNDPDARLEVGNATRNFVDGTDDLLVADDAEIDGDIYTTKLLASANINGTTANLTKVLASANVNGTVANFNKVLATGSVNGATANFTTGNITTVNSTTVNATAFNGTTFNGGTIDGDFTNGSVIFSNLAGELTQNNDNFFWNNNLTRLGLGNNTPNATLDVNGQIMMRGGANNGYFLTSDGNGLASWTDPTGLSIDNANLLDGLDSTQFLRSDTSDNYTSGTLTLDAGTTFDINSTAVSIADDNITFDAASTTFTQSSGAFTLSPAAGSNVNVSLSGTGDLVVNTNDLVVDTSSSYVGIGVTTPDAALEVGDGTANSIDGADDVLIADDLEVDGDIYTTKLIASANINGTTANLTKVLASANVNGVTANFTTVNATAFNGTTFNGGTIDGDFTNGSVIFSNLAGELTQNNDNFFWNNNLTRLGLGNNTPNATLDVNGQIMMRGGANNGYFLTSDANGLASWTDPTGLSIDNANLLDGLDSTQFLRSDTSDNYTSGTLTLDAGTTFDINSTAVSIADDNITFDAASTTFTQSSGAFTVAPAAGSNLNINLSGAGDLVVNTNDLYVDSSTSFTGIGTNTPATNLDINGSIRIQGGSPQQYHVLSALDDNGLATWSDISSILTNGGAFINALNDAISDLQSNLFLGNGAGLNHTGEYNTGVGIRSLTGLTAGNGNTAYGYQAADNLTAGNGNIAIGNNVDLSAAVGSNQLNIGNTIYGNLANGELAVGFSTNDPDARLEVGNATRNFVDGTDDLLVADDAEIDGDIYTTKLLASANINGTTANLTKVLASANVNGTVANFNKVLATGSVNGATANFTTGNITTINSTTVNATAFNGTTFNGGTIDGDFTNGSVIFSNLAGELTQNNDNFFWNNNLTRLGLGNNAPNATLDVNGQIMMRGGANNGYFLTSDGNGLASWTDPTGLSIDNANLLDSLDSTQFLRSDTSDNYTSGTLTLDAGTTFDINSTAVSIADDNITFDAASTTFTQSSGAFTLSPAAGSNVNVSLSGTGDLVVNTNDLVVDTSSSYVGIGVTTPDAALEVGDGTAGFIDGTDDVLIADDLEVDGDIYTTKLIASANINGTTANLTKVLASANVNGVTANFTTINSTTVNATAFNGTTFNGGTIDGDFTNGSVIFSNLAGELTQNNDNFFWNNNLTRLGLGNNAPNATLDVNGQIMMRTGATNGYFMMSDGNGLASWTDPTGLSVDNANLLDGLDSTQFLRSDTSDNYTSGTLTLDAGTTFDINSTAVSIADDNITFDAASTTFTQSSGAFTVTPAAGSNVNVSLSGTGDLVVNTNDLVVDTSSSYVGIGVTTPDAALEVGDGTAGFIDGADDVLIADDLEVDGDTYTTKLIASANINGTTANLTKVLASANVNGVTANFTTVNATAFNGTTFNGGTIDGDFTNGSVIFSNLAGELTQNNDNFFWNNNLTRLGLGNNSPNATLDVNGQIMMRTGATNGYFMMSDANGLASWTDPTGLSVDNANLLDGLDSTQFLRSDTSDNYTSGTLTLDAGTTFDINSTAVSIADDNISFDAASTTFTQSSGAFTLSPAAGSNVNVSLSGTGDLVVNTNDLVVDTSSSYVGIGVTTPDAALEVGDGTANSIDGADDVLIADDLEVDGDIYTTKLIASSNINGTTANLTTVNSTTVNATAFNGTTFNGGTIDGDFTNGSVIFSNLAGELTQNNDNFFWNNNLTRLGLGNNAPNATLDVNGQIMMRTGANNGYFMMSDGNGLASWTDPTGLSVDNANLLDGLDSTQFLRSDTSDNYTSGTLTLDAGTTFDINSTALSIADDNITFDAASTTFTQSSGAFTVTPAAGSNVNVSLSGTGDLVVNTNDLVVDTSSSYVGIGVTTPDAALEVGDGTAGFIDGTDDVLIADDLEVDGDIYTTKLIASSNINGTTANLTKVLASANVNGVTANFTTVNATAFNGTTFNGGTIDGDFTNGSVIFSNLAGELTQNNDNFFWNDNLTRLGLGNNTPNATLDVNGQIIMRTGAINGYLMMSDANGLASWEDPTGLSIDNANTLDGLDSTQFLRSDTSDNYTSGTLTLDAGTTFDINSTAVSIADDNITFDAASTTFTQSSGAFTLSPAAGSNLNVSLSGAGDLVINTNDLVVDTSSSYVGIGVTTPDAALEVGDGTAGFIDGTDDVLIADDLEVDGDIYTTKLIASANINGTTANLTKVLASANVNGATANFTKVLATGSVNGATANFTTGNITTINATTVNSTAFNGTTFNGGTIDGDFTNGSIIFSNLAGELTQNNDNFFWNNNLTRLGLGNNTPNATLDVNGQIMMRTGATNGYFMMSDANGLASWTDPTGLSIDNANLLDGLDSTQFLRSDTSDNYTSGTLTLDAGTTFDINSTALSIADDNITFDAASTTFTQSSGAFTVVPAAGSNVNVSLSGTGDLVVNTNDLVVDTSSSYVGIGVTTPDAALEVGDGTAGFIDGTDDVLIADDLEVDGDIYTTKLIASANINGTTANLTKVLASANVNGATANFTKVLATGSVNGATANFTTGNITTINATTVNSTAFNGTTFNGGTIDGDFTNGSVIFSNLAGELTQNNDNFFWNNNLTRLGLGNNAPNATLDVNGQIMMRTGATNGYFMMSDANGLASWTDPTGLSVDNANLLDGLDSTQFLRSDTSDNYTSGTLTLDAGTTFDINSTALSIADDNITFDAASTTFTQSSGAFTVAPAAGSNVNVSLSGTGDLVVNTNDLVVDTSSSYVGIGVTTPDAALEVGDGTANSIDGTDDVLIADDLEVDGDIYTTKLIASANINGTTANLTKVLASANVNGATANFTKVLATGSVNGATANFTTGNITTINATTVNSTAFNGTTFNGGTIDGDFTNGSIIFSNLAGELTQNNDNFFWNNNLTRLGLGNNVPNATLDVNGQIMMRTGATNGYLMMSDANGLASWEDPTGLSIDNANTLDGLDSTQFLRSDTSDNYTSGTLTLDAGTTFDINSTAVSIADDNITFDAASTTFTQSSGAFTFSPAAGSNVNVSLSGTGDLVVNTNDLVVDTSSSYVGIGVTTPDAALEVGDGTAGFIDGADDVLIADDLEVDGDIYTTKLIASSNINGTTANLTKVLASANVNGATANFTTINSTTVNATAFNGTTFNGGTIDGDFTNGSIIFSNLAGELTQNNDNFFWNNNLTRLGLGNNAPNATLDVNGQIMMRTGATNGYLMMSDGNGLASWEDPTGLSIDNANTLDGLDSTQFLRSDTSDSYTSGTLTLDAGTTFDINSTAVSIADDNITFDAASTTFTQSSGAFTLSPAAGSNVNVSLSGTGDLVVNTNDLVVDTSSSYVGIGVTTPDAALEVGDGTANSIDGADDVLIADDLEVDGDIYTTKLIASSNINGTIANLTKVLASANVNGATANFTTGNITTINATTVNSTAFNGTTFNGGTIDGDFTNGSILFANLAGEITQNNDNFFWDNNLTRLGIAINTPDATLDINGQIMVRGGSPSNGYILTTDGNGLASWSDPTGLSIDNANTLDGLDSSQFLRSDTSDNYTSGTLTLDAGTTFDINSTALSIADDNITFDAASTTFTQSSGAFTLSPAAGSNVNVSLSGTGDLVINTNDLVVDTSSSYVGIGVTTPDAALEVGDGTANSIDGADDVLIADDLEVDGDIYTTKLIASANINGTTANLTKVLASANVNGATANFTKILATGSVNGATANFTTGNITTINSTTVNATAFNGTTFNGGTIDGDFTNGSVIFSNLAGELTQNNDNFFWDNNLTRLGIAINTPDATLDINGQIMVRGGSPSNGYILTTDGNGLASWSDPTGLSIDNANTLDGLDSSQFLRSDTSDNYTSGTLTLDAGTTFDINSTAVSIADDNITFDAASTTFTQSSGAFTLSPAAGSNVNVSLSGTGDLVVNTNDLVVDTSSSYVGIGVTTPDAALEVGDGTANSIDGADDVLIADDLEVDGDIYTTKLIASANINGTTANLTKVLASANVNGATANFTKVLATGSVNGATANFTTGNITTINATTVNSTAFNGTTFNGGTIDGDFTNGSILFANLAGEITQNNDNFFWDNNLTRLGIAINTPDATLDINGQIMVRGGSPSNGYILTTDGNGLASWSDPTGLSIDNANTLDGLDSSQFLRSDTSDNYTSGTLTLDAGTTFDINSTAVSIADDNITFDAASTTFTQSSGAFTLSPAAGSNVNVSLSGTGDLVVNTNDLVVDTSSSYVGIGVTTPDAALEVGDGTANSIDGADDVLIADDLEVDGDIYTTKLIASANINGTTANLTKVLASANVNGATANFTKVLATGSVNGATANFTTGNITTINSTTVNATAFNGTTFNGGTIDGDFTNGSVIFSNLAGELTQNNDNFFWDNNLTRLGIAINTPDATLDINGQIMVRGGSPSNGYILTTDGNGLASWSDPTGLSIDNANTLDGLDSSQFLRSDTSDNYTSGTLTLDAGTTFDINSTAVSIADDNITFDAANTTFTQSSGAFTLSPAAGSNLNVSLSGTGDLVINTNDLVVDTSSSYVGIGVTTPDAALEVGDGTANSIDGADDVLIADDLEVDGDIYTTKLIASANINGTTANLTKVLASANVNGVTANFTTINATAFNGTTFNGGTIDGDFTNGSVIFSNLAGELTQNNDNFFWDNNLTRLGIAINTPDATLDINGQIMVRGGSPSNGYILTTDGNGLASWSDPTGLSIDNANTLDGLDSSQFLRSDTSDNYTSGTLTLDAGTTFDINSTALSIADDNITFDSASTTFTQTTGAITVTPAAGSNLNISLSGAGDLAVSTDDIYVDTSANQVGIMESSPTSTLHVSGSFSLPISTKTGNYTVTATDHTILANATSGVIEITLPSASGIAGRIYVIKKSDSSSNDVRILTAGVETIDGSSSRVLNAAYESVTLQSDGTNWFVI